MSHPLPSGAARLVSRRPVRDDLALPPADYPSNARCFVHLDARLLPYWHTLFDLCPGLLKLDPPEGLDLFRSFMTWAYRNRPLPDWTYHLNVCRWLLGSPWRTRIDEEPIEAFMTAAAARWASSDTSRARGVVLGWLGSPVQVFDCKTGSLVQPRNLPPLPWDFGWCAVDNDGRPGVWRPVP